MTVTAVLLLNRSPHGGGGELRLCESVAYLLRGRRRGRAEELVDPTGHFVGRLGRRRSIGVDGLPERLTRIDGRRECAPSIGSARTRRLGVAVEVFDRWRRRQGRRGVLRLCRGERARGGDGLRARRRSRRSIGLTVKGVNGRRKRFARAEHARLWPWRRRRDHRGDRASTRPEQAERSFRGLRMSRPTLTGPSGNGPCLEATKKSIRPGLRP